LQDTSLLLFVVQIAGAAALLIWAVRLVRTGVERAFVVQLRLWLRRSTRSRVLAVTTGLVSAMMLQSSTAVAMLVAGFASGAGIAGAVGLAILLGADIGSALVAKILLVRLSFLEPLALLLGVGLFLKGSSQRIRQTGRILIGLALIFLSLDLIRAATAPLVDSPGAAVVMQYLARDLMTAFAIGAVFAWLVHSSVAAVLLFVTLVAQGLLPQTAAIAMVLGANLGGTMIAFMLSYAAPVAVRRMIIANVVLRGGGALIALGALGMAGPSLSWLGATDADVVINLHLAFNLAIALIALPFVGPVMKAGESLLPDRPDPASADQPISALDPAGLDNAPRALSCAAREIMRMGEMTEAMLREVNTLYDQWDDSKSALIARRAAQVHNMHHDLKLYLAALHRRPLDEEAISRSAHLSTVAVNLEGAADMIARSMVDMARRLTSEGLHFSAEGRFEIADFHDRVLANTQLSLNLMMTQNPAEARNLVTQKESVRKIEENLQRAHLGRLREGRVDSIETSSIHQETLRALKYVNSAFTMVAHPILIETGDLLESRLARQSSENHGS
jgi:phosphate:Na+ symporter